MCGGGGEEEEKREQVELINVSLKGIESFPGNLLLCERLHSASVSQAVQRGRSDKHAEEEHWKHPAVASTSEVRMRTV